MPALLALMGGIATEASGQVVAPGAAVAPGGAYGGYGFGGWDSAATPFGRAAMGMGAFAQGLGAGDLMSTEAGAIRTESMMELNEYLYRSRMLQRERYRTNRARQAAAGDQARQAIQDRVINNPTRIDIESGDTLNNILFALDDPSIPDSVIRDAAQGVTLPGQTIQKIPFMFSHRGAAISLQRLTTEDGGWPAALQAEALAPLRDRYHATIEQILEVPEGDPVPSGLIGEARSILGEMYRTIQLAQLDGPVAAEAIRYLKAQAGMVAMLQQPDVKQVIDEAAMVEEVDLPVLLNFMRAYNLQFGAADTPEEKALYGQQLYPLMAQVRDNLGQQFGAQPSAPAPGDQPPAGPDQRRAASSPAAAFEGFDWEQLGIPSGNPPAPGEQPVQGNAPDQPLSRGAPRIDPGSN